MNILNKLFGTQNTNAQQLSTKAIFEGSVNMSITDTFVSDYRRSNSCNGADTAILQACCSGDFSKVCN